MVRKTKKRAAIIITYGRDCPEGIIEPLVESLSEAVGGKVELMVSSATDDIYDYFDNECS